MFVNHCFGWWSCIIVVLCFDICLVGSLPRNGEITADEINKRSSTTVLYRVNVKTAADLGAGTDADVFIQIFGTLGETSVVELTKSGNLFESGSVDEFIFVDNAVGTLTKVGIKRNTEGLFDDWKLDEVTIEPAGSYVYKFAFNEWIKPNEWIYSYGG